MYRLKLIICSFLIILSVSHSISFAGHPIDQFVGRYTDNNQNILVWVIKNMNTSQPEQIRLTNNDLLPIATFNIVKITNQNNNNTHIEAFAVRNQLNTWIYLDKLGEKNWTFNFSQLFP